MDELKSISERYNFLSEQLVNKFDNHDLGAIVARMTTNFNTLVGYCASKITHKETLEREISKMKSKEVKRCSNCKFLDNWEEPVSYEEVITGAFCKKKREAISYYGTTINCRDHELKEGAKKLYEEA